MIAIILFIIGAVIGSFLNVAALRFNTGLGVGGRSFCPECGTTLRWYELVPAVSYLALRGRCRSCRTRISIQYLLVEVWTGLIFLSIFNFQFSILQNILLLAIFSIYVVITIYDAKHKIIPDSLVYASVVLAIAFAFLAGRPGVEWLGGPVLFVFFALIWLLSRGRAMGFGDAKLGASIGFLLGLSLGLSAAALAFWIGTAAVIGYVVIQKLALSGRGLRLTMKSEVPFGPFLVIGAWLALAFHLDIFHVANFL